MPMSKRSIIWFRRDLRISDHPALLAALDESPEIVPVFILDPKLIKTLGSKRLAYLGQSLRALDESLGNNLQVIAGDPLTVLKDLQKKYEAESVHISAEYEPYGATQDKKIEDGLDASLAEEIVGILKSKGYKKMSMDGVNVY